MIVAVTESRLCEFACGEHRPLEFFVWDRKVSR